jgi:ubiquitin-like-conjugating enzyme ATG3
VDSAANPGEIDDILDLDGDGLAGAMANVSIASDTGATLENSGS